MSWDDVWKIGLTVLGSLGGVGVIIGGIVNFCSNIIAESLSKKYDLKLAKELEKYKAGIDNKTYISKTKFDTEFSLYRDLSSAFSDMVKTISILIPAGFTNVPADRDERLRLDKNHYESAVPAVVKAQDTLNSNIPFISEEIYNGYLELLCLARQQLGEYENRFLISDLRPQEEKERFSHEAYQCTREINEKWKKLNNIIREYISTLDVMEEK